ncbi:hypothetical protein A3D11_03975 [Candidatus Peribacteria bacterium RIFCSPHIGHO2_02_FULL_49_16]|nr:MAG: hypothetical protein A2880_03210 [Candidatus Peribacteria bacterium RIFCSPHIGHO2_01_FULL_49_38]OGJ59159.1 MAG: hypothetical protein A3D11_03975 [Candidatus Peribacteria bacterium RIFCSPHIGHO2_02_FULL_49_16]
MREIRIILGVIIFGFLFALAFFILTGKQWDGKSVLTLSGPNEEEIEVRVEVADTAFTRTQGLQNRQELEEKSGMLFIVEYPQVLTFWMKNTLIPLDVLFFDEEGILIKTLSMEPCKVANCPTHSSDAAVLYALEVHAGFVNDYGVKKGWKFKMR